MWLDAHVACVLISYLAFLVGFTCALMYLVLERQLKAKRLGPFSRWLPPLDVLDRVNLVAVTVGFLLYSVGLGLGAVVEYRTFGRWVSGDPKEILSTLTWFSYASLLYVRLLSIDQGRRVAMYSVVGFSWLVFAFVAARFLLPTWHAFAF